MSRSISALMFVIAGLWMNPLCAQQYLKLSELDHSLSQQSYSAPQIDRSVAGHPLSVGGEKFENGLGVHSKFVMQVKLNGAHSFNCLVGLNDGETDLSVSTVKSIPLTDGKRIFYDITESRKQFLGIEGKAGQIDPGAVIFRVLHNGKEIYSSGVMKKGDAARAVTLKVKGGELTLITESAKEGDSGNEAVWLNPEFEYFEVPPVAVSTTSTQTRIQLDDEIATELNKKINLLSLMTDPYQAPEQDWLINQNPFKAGVYQRGNGKDIILSNGLIARVFRLNPNLATIDYINQMTGETLLRGVSNEGVLVLDGKAWKLGGLSDQREYGYTMMNWVDELYAVEGSFSIRDFEVREITDRLKWKRVRWSLNKEMPTGKELIFTLEKDGIIAKIHFELYDGIPAISKWIEVINESEFMVQLNSFKLEQLALVEGESLVDTPKHWLKPNIHFESDYAFGAMQQKTSDRTTYWEKDPRYTSQTNYPLNLPCLLEIRPPLGPDSGIDVGESLQTFRIWELPMDSRDQERQGLFKRKFYRTVSPWTTENPIFLHLTSSNPKVIKEAVDQCAAVGYEMIILSFGSGLNMEKENELYYDKYSDLVEYANSKGIELGGYSLLSSRWISDEVDVINPKTGKRGGMIFGSSPCLSSEWGADYFRKIKKFFDKTGMQVFENDGSYPGNVCASTQHAHHDGLGDSQWKQYAQIQGLYKWMRGRGIYMNVPDFYLNSGTNKTGIGYREVNWSLPRDQQLILGRQNIYDGLWDRIPSMCWTFVPLTQYHGGGAAATMEPLKDHLVDYENQMMQNYGSGVQACYRGPRLYDAPETKAKVIEVIDWYKKYRQILNSDIIHLRRPGGKDWDGFLHVNPKLKHKGLAMIFNPTHKEMIRTIELPLYYTGLEEEAQITIDGAEAGKYSLSRDYKVSIKVAIQPNSYSWILIE